MKTIPIIIAAAIACSSAEAAVKCDRFKVWRYHFRQACNQRAIYLARHAPPPHQFHTPYRIAAKAAPVAAKAAPVAAAGAFAPEDVDKLRRELLLERAAKLSAQ